MSIGRQIFQALTVWAALMFLGLVTFLGVQYARGVVDAPLLANLVRVVAGERMFTMSRQEVTEYQELLEMRQQMEEAATQTGGTVRTREAAARAAQEALERQQERFTVLQGLLETEKNKIAALISENAALRTELEAQRTLNAQMQLQARQQAESEQAEELRKTLSNMEPEDIARFIEEYSKSANGILEAVHYLREYTRPDQRAEILTEMAPLARQQILPLLASEYAGLAPGQVLQRWRATNPPPEIMADAMMKMPAVQAFGVFLQLDPDVRARLAPLLLSN